MTYKKLVENMVKAKGLKYMSDVLERTGWKDLSVDTVKVEWVKDLKFWNWEVLITSPLCHDYRVGGYINDDDGEIVVTSVEDRVTNVGYYYGWRVKETEYCKDLKRLAEEMGAA